MVVEETRRISFELTKLNKFNQALLVPWCRSSTFISGSYPEFERV